MSSGSTGSAAARSDPVRAALWPAFRAAVDQLNRRRAAAARRALERLIADHPEFPWAYQQWVECQLRLGRPEAAEAWLRARLAAAPNAARLRYALGYLLRQRGRSDAAIAELRQALALDPACAAARMELGWLQFDAGSPGGRRRIAAALARCLRNHDRWGEARALSLLGHVDRFRFDYPAAIARYRDAVHLHLEVGDALGGSMALLNLGMLHFCTSELRLAGGYLRHALALQQAMGDRSFRLRTLANLGSLAMRINDFHAARAQFRQALRLAERAGRAVDIAVLLDNLGLVSACLGQPRRARRYLTAALAIKRTIGEPGREAETLRHLGWLALTRSEVEPARRFSLAARRRARAGSALDQWVHATSQLAGVELAAGRSARAVRYARESLRQARRLAGPAGAFVEELTARLRLAQGYARLGRHRAAWTETRAIIDDVEASLPEQARTDLQLGLMELNRAPYEHAVELALGAAGGSGHEPAAGSFVDAERSRARVLRSLLGRAEPAPQPAGLERRRALLETALRQVQAAQVATEATTPQRRLQRHRSRLMRELEAVTRELEEHRSERDLAPPPSPATLAGQLADDAALLAYLVGDDAVYGWSVRPSGTRVRRLAVSPERLGREVRAFVRGFAAGAATDIRLLYERLDVGRAHRLYRWLIAPFAAELATARQLVVVADGSLHHLPFEALVTDPDAYPSAASWWSGPRYLIEAWAVSYIPAASLLSPPRRAGRRRSLFGLGAAPAVSVPGVPATPLPHAAAELRAAAGLIAPSRLCLGASATEDNYRTLAGRHSVIHLATHAVIDDLRPDFSGLVVAPPADGGGAGDHLLQAYEIARVPLAAELVVLSGCHSGSGRLRKGEGLMSLARAFHVAGADAVLVSLWAVADRSIAELMTEVYRRLDSGRAAALQAAKRRFLEAGRTRADEPFAHPFHWAPLVLVDSRPGSLWRRSAGRRSPLSAPQGARRQPITADNRPGSARSCSGRRCG